jgi:hypothetical protein
MDAAEQCGAAMTREDRLYPRAADSITGRMHTRGQKGGRREGTDTPVPVEMGPGLKKDQRVERHPGCPWETNRQVLLVQLDCLRGATVTCVPLRVRSSHAPPTRRILLLTHASRPAVGQPDAITMVAMIWTMDPQWAAAAQTAKEI